MTFKAAKCPSCAGDLQVPDDRAAVKCMYCGSDIVVAEAIDLAVGRVQTHTIATAVEGTSGKGCGMFLVVVASFPVLLSVFLLVSSTEKVAAIFPFILALLLGVGGYFLYVQKPQVTHYEGECPYCGTHMSFPLYTKGLNCFACHKRIVFRDMKFISVDTPIGVARK